MQSAYWVVNGTYQSYETSDMKIELELEVSRMFGQMKRLPLRDKPGDALFRKAKQTIDNCLKDDWFVLVPSRASEARSQLAAGLELANFGPAGLFWISSYNTIPPAKAIRERHNMDEAIRAFETVLLLDPENRDARMYLAACLRNPTILRIEESRELYRQLLESPIQDKWTRQAQEALLHTFAFQSPEDRAHWFARVAQPTTNSPAQAFYHQALEQARQDAVIGAQDQPAQELAETRLFEAMKQWHSDLVNHIHIIDFYNTGLGKYVESFGTNRAAAARRLVDLLPKLQQQTPALAPHILAGVVSFQVDTNAPVIEEFERSLDAISEHPEKIFEPKYYYNLISGPLFYSCEKQKMFGLAAQVLEHRDRASRVKQADPLDHQRRMSQAFVCMAVEQWQKAIDVFQTWSNRPVWMGNRGLWGPAFTTVFPTKEIAFCRNKLGLPVISDPCEFDLGEACVCLHPPSRPNFFGPAAAFAADSDGLWIACPGRLLHLDAGLQTNLDVALPATESVTVNCIALTPTTVWMGTAGSGLLEFDRPNRQCRRLTEADGLLMNFVTQVFPAGDTLWLGYGSEIGGGLGRFDLRTRKAVSFATSILPNLLLPEAQKPSTDLASAPPRQALQQMAADTGGDVWFTEDSRLRRFHSEQGIWEEFPQAGRFRAFALQKDLLFAASYSSDTFPTTGLLGLNILDLRDGKWRRLRFIDGLPQDNISALTVHGQDLWIGGLGFVAQIDPDRNAARHFAYLDTRAVSRIQICEPYLWVQADRHLYRVPLHTLK